MNKEKNSKADGRARVQIFTLHPHRRENGGTASMDRPSCGCMEEKSRGVHDV